MGGMEDLGSQIRAERQRRGMSGRDLADLAGLSAVHVSLLERGRRSILTASARAVFRALGLRLVIALAPPEEPGE